MRLGNIVERHDAPAETEKKQRAEGDEGPEWKLQVADVSGV